MSISSKYTHYLELILVLTQKELKVRYKNNVLGYFWSILNPLAMGMVFFVAFQIFMRMKVENYLLFLLAALFPWQWFSNSVGSSPHMFIGNASLIKKLNFPRILIPITVVLQDGVHFFLSLPVFVVFMLIYGLTPQIIWIWGVPLLIITSFLTITGMVLIVATLNLFFRDLANLTMIAVNMLFYCTPIIYSADMIPEQYQPLIALNPVAPLYINWRNVLFSNKMDWHYMAFAGGYAILFLIVGSLVYKKLSYKFAEVL